MGMAIAPYLFGRHSFPRCRVVLDRGASSQAYSPRTGPGKMIMDYVKVASASDVAEGVLVPVEAGGLKLLVTKVGGTYYAAQRKCPHLGFNLCRGKIEGEAVVCPLHKAKFDLKTGQIERDPRLLFIGMKAKTDLTTYPVKEEDGALHVAVPKPA